MRTSPKKERAEQTDGCGDIIFIKSRVKKKHKIKGWARRKQNRK
jgi:hypothetical protein